MTRIMEAITLQSVVQFDLSGLAEPPSSSSIPFEPEPLTEKMPVVNRAAPRTAGATWVMSV